MANVNQLKKIKKMSKYIFHVIGLLFVLVLYFQNCSNESNPLVLQAEFSSLSVALPPLPIDHPPEKTDHQTTVKFQQANRDYVAALMRDVFTADDDSTPAEFENHLERWIVFRGNQFGLGCDVYSSYTGQDCFWQVEASNLPVQMDDNPIRQSYIVQFCQSVLATDTAVQIVKKKISPEGNYPNRESIIKIFNLFYRANNPNENVINSLLDFDRALAENNEDQTNRWRGMILQVCESPGWQLF